MITPTASRRRSDRVRDLLVVLWLLGLCALFFWQLWTANPQNRRWLASGDFTDQFYAFRYYQARELWSGRWPLWNPYTFSGSPFLADIQSAVYYPIGLLIILLAGRSGLSLFAVEVEVMVHYFLVSLFTYLFVRRLTRNRWAGLVGSLVYSYGSYLTSYPKLQMAILEGQTWVPLILLAVLCAGEEEGRGNRRRSSAWLTLGGLGLALSALAGHAQTFLLAFYTVLAYLIFTFFPAWRRATAGEKVRLAARLLLLPAVGLGAAAAQWLPSVEYMRLSTRAHLGFAQAGGGFLYSDLLALVLPGLRVIYIGVLPLILAVLALVLERRRETTFWGVTAVVALLLSLGRRTVLFTLFYLFVPGFNLFQGQERALQVFSLAAAVLAGVGTARLTRSLARPVKDRVLALGGVLRWANIGAWMLVLFAYWGTLYLAQQPEGQVSDLLERSVLLALLLGLSTGVLGLRLGHRFWARRAGWLVVALILFDLFTLNQGRDLERAQARDRFAATPAVRYLQAQSGCFRVWDEGLWPGNFGMVWGLEETGGISPLRLQRYQDLLQALPEEKARWLLNVHYVVSSRDSLPDGELLSEYSDPERGFFLHRVREPGQPAYLVYQVEVEPDEKKARQRLAAADFDLRRRAIVAQEPGMALAGSGQGTARVVERVPGRLVVEAQTDANALLVLSEIDYPGWQARLDGQKAPLVRANTILRAVPLPAGAHRLEMDFRPWTVLAGQVLSALTVIAAVVAVWRWLRAGP